MKGSIKNKSVIPSCFTSKTVQEKFARLGVNNEISLILHLPIRYEDETHLCQIGNISGRETVQIEGIIISSEVMYRPRRQLVLQVEDNSGILFIRFLNFYSSQIKTYSVGTRVRLLGEPRPGFFGTEMVHPKCHIVHEDTPLPDSLTPVYSTTAGLSQTTIRKLVRQVLIDKAKVDNLSETIPVKTLKNYRLNGFKDSIIFLHQPASNVSAHLLEERIHPAWSRIKFDELLAQQLSMRLHYKQRQNYLAPTLPDKKKLTKKLLNSLPFSLTGAQKRTFSEISRDLSKSYPMQRLLQGDVGSGKTIVAALAALQAIENGYQVAIMAPTEILAEQHYQKLSDWFKSIFSSLGVSVALLSGSQKRIQRKATLSSIAAGNAMLAIGTHALFQDQVEFRKLGLAVIDEQHRFGVNQRLALRMKCSKDGMAPHQLMMSATPIPRTLSMSYYADLDVSVLNELPPGRIHVVTKLFADIRRKEVVVRIKEACCAGKQAYWVCPLIEESEVLQLKTTLDTYERLSIDFPDLKVGLLHGRLPPHEKLSVMELFKQGDIQLLVATTVIEVGVDVPNASLMVIEHAERMGLSQLHQLRGRVGRGADASVCILLYKEPLSEVARKRLRIIFEHNDGFEISRQDFLLRGPGEFFGVRQSGVPMLRFADPERDEDLLKDACNVAEEMMCEYPELAQRHLQRWLGEKSNYLKV